MTEGKKTEIVNWLSIQHAKQNMSFHLVQETALDGILKIFCAQSLYSQVGLYGIGFGSNHRVLIKYIVKSCFTVFSSPLPVMDSNGKILVNITIYIIKRF